MALLNFRRIHRSLAARVFGTRLGRLVAARGGATAVEFALIAPAFFLLLFGILEVGLIFLTSTTLDNAALDAAREIRTGQLQNGGAGLGGFRTEVCDKLFGLMDCDSNLYIDVRSWDDFDDVDQPDPLADGTIEADDFDFDPGEEADVVLVRIFYNWSLFTPLLGYYFGDNGTNSKLISTATVFRNEPFGPIAPPAP